MTLKGSLLPILIAFLTAVVTSFGAWQVQAGGFVSRDEERADITTAIQNSPYTKDQAFIIQTLAENRSSLTRIEDRIDSLEAQYAALNAMLHPARP